MNEELCENCGREYEPETRYDDEIRFGKPKKETEQKARICRKCTEDLGLESPFDYEG